MTAETHHMDDPGELDRGPHATGTRTLLRRYPYGPARFRLDPLRGRPRRRGGPRYQEQIAGPRRLGDRNPATRSKTRSNARLLPADSSGTSDCRRISPRAPSGCWNRRYSTHSAWPIRRAWSRRGFGRTGQALEREDVAAVLHAAEAAPDGVRKLDAAVRHRPSQPPPVIEFLTSAQLDLALGRPNVVHAALLAGPASDTFLSRSRRLERFRTGGAGDRGNRAGKAATH